MTQTTADDFDAKWDELGRGHEVEIEGHEDRFLVVDTKKTTPTTKVAVDVIDEDGEKYRFQKVVTTETFIDVREGHESAVVRNTADIDPVQDFEIVGQNTERLEDYFREEFEMYQ
jgi:hypothetical protein